MERQSNTPFVLDISDQLHDYARPVHVTYDGFGAVIAEYFYFPLERISYIRWRGHVTAEALIKVGEVGMHINQQLEPLGLMHDARGTTGDWGEAASWVEFVWIPEIQSRCTKLRFMSFLCDGETPMPYMNLLLLEKLDQQFEFQQFYALRPAWRWMIQRARQYQNHFTSADSLVTPPTNASADASVAQRL